MIGMKKNLTNKGLSFNHANLEQKF